jgi:polar amino acid transport system permease protein
VRITGPVFLFIDLRIFQGAWKIFMRELFEMSFEVVKASLPMFFSGLKLTLLYSFFGIAGSIVVGLACSLVKYFKITGLRRIVSAYVELARNTPLLIQLFFLYYAFPVIGLKMSSSTCGIVGLIFLGGAYMAEGFNGGA